MADEFPREICDAARAAWHQYIDFLTPFQPDLFRYCLRLTGNVWDAEDLAQDAVVRGFGVLNEVYATITNPRGYLIRIATNLWVDRMRRNASEARTISLFQRTQAKRMQVWSAREVGKGTGSIPIREMGIIRQQMLNGELLRCPGVAENPRRSDLFSGSPSESRIVGDVGGSHVGAQLPSQDVAREVVEYHRQIEPAPASGQARVILSCGELQISLIRPCKFPDPQK